MRLELSNRTDLALRALEALCRQGNGALVTGGDLAQSIGTTTNYLPQVMMPLVRRGWVRSTRGPSGGYRLAASHSDIQLLDLIESVEGPTADGRCVLRGAPCPVEEPCALHVPWTRARDALLSELASTPVQEMGCRARHEEGNDE